MASLTPYHARWAATPRPRHLTTAMALALLAGCASLAPEYTRPSAPIPQAYETGLEDGGHSPAAAIPAWRAYFSDPVLVRLIETALENNRDLRIAALRVEEARSAFRIQRSDRFPDLSVGAQGGRSRVPGDLNITGEPVVGGEYRAEVGLNSWELDLWGRIRSLESAALQNWLATDAARQAVQVALIAQVADGYLGLREIDERVQIARQSVASRQESYRIFQRRYEVGSTSKLDLTQVQTLLTQAQSLYTQLERQRATQINNLRQLVGGDPGVLPQAAPFDETTVLADLAPGLPAQLLANRPDIMAAEHQLRGANANIGSARAAFFPRIALTGTFGTASAELDGLFDSGSRAWLFAPTISLPIFDGGRRRANLDLAQVRRDLSVARYEQTIQTAFREVADALSARLWIAQQLDVQRTARAAQAERARLAQLRYDNGSAAYLEVLDAQRDLLDAEQQLVQVRRALLSSQIALYSALGGSLTPAERAGPQASAAQPSSAAALSSSERSDLP
ncbi:TPA: efflux transporter outer membrane subunit [Pseudomonas aeruginosa]|nr:efflux transporter outer membrane subunit [Pseudomonas aeruginosa]